MLLSVWSGVFHLFPALQHLTHSPQWKEVPGTDNMAASAKTSKSHVIFKKVSRDKSVSGTEVRGFMESAVKIIINGDFLSVDMIDSKSLCGPGKLCGYLHLCPGWTVKETHRKE